MVNSSAFVGISSVSCHNGHSWLGPASSTFTLRWRSLLNTLDGATRFFYNHERCKNISHYKIKPEKNWQGGQKVATINIWFL